ncbi:MAG: TonB-dependent receptor, partial [Myxococcaceae bacterium]|nr:TonB-dependent receptor [Myxococcaceae bacterium]
MSAAKSGRVKSASTAVLCAGALLLSTVAAADNTADEADVAFSLGNQAYGKRDYEKALSAYLLSNRLVPNRNVLFNIARCFEALDKYDEAFRYYFELSSEQLATDDAREVRQALARLTPKVALLTVSSEPGDADVYVDREDLGSRGRTPLTLALSPGPHTVILKRAGYRNAQGKASLSRGRDSKLKVPLERILGAVELTGTPEGASVRETLDGPELAKLPAKLSFVPGQKLLVITADGFTPQQLLVDVKPDAVQATTARLVPLPLPTGKVTVTANRENALVRVNGKESGFTPTVLSLPEGEYEIEVSARDLTTSKTTVKVGKDTEERISAELRYLPPPVRAASKSLLSVDEAPASVTVITREELQSFGYQTLAEALQAVRGIFISNDRVYTYIGIRGFSPPGDLNTRIAILWDGHVMNDVWAGQGFSARDLDVDLNEIDRIEVVRGPGSALYGTGALFAVINCVPRDSLGDRHVEGTAAAGGVGGVSARATGAIQGTSASILLTAAGFLSKGADTTDFGERPNGDSGVVNGLDGERSIGAALRAKAGGFTLSAKWNQRRKEVPNSALGATFGVPGTKYVDVRGFAELRYDKDFGRVSFGARLSYDASRFRGVYAIAETGEPIRYDEDIGGGDWLGLELRTRIRLFHQNFLTVGFEGQGSQVFQNSYAADTAPLPTDVRQRLLLSGYLLDEWRIHPRLFIQGGVRVDKYLDLTTVPISPRLGIVARPYQRGLTKLVAGQAFRAPNIYE